MTDKQFNEIVEMQTTDDAFLLTIDTGQVLRFRKKVLAKFVEVTGGGNHKLTYNRAGNHPCTSCGPTDWKPGK